jgi:hypothetical protein
MPLIYAQPQNQFIPVGSNATFTVAAIPQSSLTYHWWFGNAPIAGAINASLTINNAQWFNAGNYSVVVSNQSGSVTSTIAQLTIYTNLAVVQTNQAPPPPGNPTIPTDATHFNWDFPYGFWPTTSMGLFHDFHPARPMCKNFFRSFFQFAIGFLWHRGCFGAIRAFSHAFPPHAKTPLPWFPLV